jgi:DNA topoisomerase IA
MIQLDASSIRIIRVKYDYKMRAQQLYERGFISYMRTDSTHLSNDAKSAIKSEIVADFGGPNKYVGWMRERRNEKQTGSSTNNNKPEPQAAHEAIRPAIQNTGRFTKPNDLPPLMVLPETCIDWSIKEQWRLICHHKIQIRLP